MKRLEKDGISHHLIAYGKKIYDYLPGKPADYPSDLHLCAIVVVKLKMIPVEFIWRKYLAGSFHKSFYAKGLPDPYGHNLVPGYPLMKKFDHALFTPTEKSETDMPLNAEEVGRQYPLATQLSLEVFLRIRRYLKGYGIDLVDSKMEIGTDQSGRVTIADEVVTPDSSRFCSSHEIREGSEPPWLDKQIARDEAERMWAGGQKVPLEFDSSVIDRLSKTYKGIFSRITGMWLKRFQMNRFE